MLNRELVDILKTNNEQGIFDTFILAVQDRELDLMKALQDWVNQVGSKTMGITSVGQLTEDLFIMLDALDWVFESPQYKFYFEKGTKKKTPLKPLSESKYKVYKRQFEDAK